MTTSIHSVMGRIDSLPTGVSVEAPCAYRVTQPNGVRLYVTHWLARPPASDNPYLANRITFEERVGSTTGPLINTGVLNTVGYTTSSSIPVLEVRLGDAHDVLPGYPNTAGHYWTRRYHYFTQDLLWELKSIYPKPDVANLQLPDLAAERRATPPSWSLQRVETTKEYNFMGNPLEQSVVESSRNASTNAWTVSPAKAVSYAYWGADKYFQQRAVRTKKDASNYRYSFTDYYDANAAQGMKGQTKAVHDAKHATYSLGSSWKYDIQPASGSVPVAEFPLAVGSDPAAYDSKGRGIRVRKLSKLVSGTPTYIETRTSYGADTDGSWGQTSQVTEAFGTPLARTSYTHSYTPDGKASQVQDAKGQVLQTSYGPDGEVNWIKRVDSGLNLVLASYTYGTIGVSNGQLDSVTDGLTGVIQSFTYITSGGGLGQVCQIHVAGGSLPTYTVDYAFNPAGERSETIYTTPNGNTRWSYGDYIRLCSPLSGSRMFQTMRKLDAVTGIGTDEEFHYNYDSAGRLANAMFGQTPQVAGGAPTSPPFYTNSYPALRRYQACYESDPAGHALGVYHRWDQWTGSSYSATPVLAFESQYDPIKKLKVQSKTFISNGLGNGWTVEGTETYGYEAERDFLISADYDGPGPATPETWTYDAAQNRVNSGYIYDHLNRLTDSPGATYTYDTLGNRITKGSFTYAWDTLNRLTAFTSASATTSYTYRGDGLRVSKASGTSSTFYRHDGQMTAQEVRLNGSIVQSVVDNAIGGRGIDAMSHTTTSGTQIYYPLYDLNGNAVGTVTRAGPSSLSDRRSYNAWGGVRAGSLSGAPFGRFGAGLGHLQDDESDLIYMRQRYYDHSTGRFLSEDPARDGSNWFIYASNVPTCLVDSSGLASTSPYDAILNTIRRAVGTSVTVLGMAFLAMASFGPHARQPETIRESCWLAAAGITLVAIGNVFYAHNDIETIPTWGLEIALGALQKGGQMKTIATIVGGAAIGNESAAKAAVAGVTNRSLQISAAMLALQIEESLLR